MGHSTAAQLVDYCVVCKCLDILNSSYRKVAMLLVGTPPYKQGIKLIRYFKMDQWRLSNTFKTLINQETLQTDQKRVRARLPLWIPICKLFRIWGKSREPSLLRGKKVEVPNLFFIFSVICEIKTSKECWVFAEFPISELRVLDVP